VPGGARRDHLRAPGGSRGIWGRVDFEGECWVWLGALNAAGYGHLRRFGYAHRLSWEMLRGPIPQGMTIDHLCRNRKCVRPDHLEVVSRAENVRRENASRSHCPQGHPYAAVNTYVYKGSADVGPVVPCSAAVHVKAHPLADPLRLLWA
jgi:hypothetical protein